MRGRCVSMAATLLLLVCVVLCAGCRRAANLIEVQRISAGAVNVVLLSGDGALHQKDPFTIEFRSAPGGDLLNVGTVRASASMPMPGMPMFGAIEVRPTDALGRYTAKGNLEMTGGWRIALEWDGPAGRGAVTFTGTVQ
jgi:YtkA-like